MQFKNNIDLGKNQILNARLQNLSSAPANPAEGQIYYNTTDKKIYNYNGTTWVDITGVSGLQISDISGLQTALDNRVAKNANITGATKTKITYDEKGLVTTGADLVEVDIPTLAQSKITNLATDLAAKATKIAGGTNGNIVTRNSGGDIQDSGKKFDDNGTGTSDIWSASKIQTAIDAVLGANDAMVYKGTMNCSANPNYPAANAGHTYKVSVAGKIGGASGINVEIGDMLICTVDGTASGTQASVGFNWSIVQTNIDGAVISAETSSIDNQIALMSGTSGKIIKKSLATIDASGNVNIPNGTKYKINGTDLSAVDVGATRKYSVNIGDGVATAISVTHNLGTRDVQVEVYTNSGVYDTVFCTVERTNTNSVTLRFATAPAASEYRVVVIG